MPVKALMTVGILSVSLLAIVSCHGGSHSHGKSAEATDPEGTVYCLVTGDKVDVAAATKDPAFHSEYKGNVYLFCCRRCKPEFESNPEKYISNPAEHEDANEHKDHGEHDH